MPPVYGGAPKCPTCGKAVYFAEQVIGPQGSYHKACLKCVACGKSLEPRLLLDHDGQAYCKSCHGKAFGAKGYGAGGALVGEYAPRPSPTHTSSPIRPSTTTAAPPQPAHSPTPAARPVPSLPTPTEPVAGTARRPLPTPPVAPPKPASIFASTSRSAAGPPPPTPPRPASFQPTPTPTTSAALPLPAATPSAPAFDALSTRHSPLPAPPPPSTRPSLSTPQLCSICHTPAYHAESLLLPSLGGSIHRRCFKCAGCGGRLELGRETVKEGRGWCWGCYRERWGVGGGLGGMTRPSLF